MAPALHFLESNEVLLAVDFANARVLIGKLARARDPKSLYRHERWTLAKSKWHGETHDDANATIDAEGWRPIRGGKPRELKCSYVPTFVKVSLSDLTKSVTAIRKLAGKSLGIDSLVTVCVHAGGVTLASHGPASMTSELRALGESAATDGLGSVVVFGEALKAAVKDQSIDPEVSIERGADSATVFVLRGTRTSVVWTVNATPVAVQSDKPAPIDYGLTPAITRALGFASTDEARPNLHCVNLRGCGDAIEVCATDGHRLYLERVKCPGFGERSYTIARSVLTSLRSAKRAGPYRFTFRDDGSFTIACDGREVECAKYGWTFPPYTQIVPQVLADPTYYPRVDLPAAEVAKLVTWLDAQEVTYTESGKNVHPIQLTAVQEGLQFIATATGNNHVLACDVPDSAARAPSRNDNTKWSMHPTFLAQALATFPRDALVHLHASHPLEPLFFFDANRVALVMPIRW